MCGVGSMKCVNASCVRSYAASHGSGNLLAAI